MIRAAIAILMLTAAPVAAQTLAFPSNAEMTSETATAVSSYDLPAGPWADGAVPIVRFEGDVTQQTWRIAARGLSTLQILRPLREQLRNAGYNTVFECDTTRCGGFDFRFAIPVGLPPAMQVNLGDFRFLSAEKDQQALSLLVSRTADAGFVQVTSVGAAPAIVAPSAPRLSTRTTNGVEQGLEVALAESGRFVLSGLEFSTGSAQLIEGETPQLDALADYLVRYPERTVALVGHTDSAGSLDGNIALSRRRAGAVLERLVGAYDVPRRQLEAQGMGYLSPRASNLTDDGRALNRRVEVIVTSTVP